MSVDLIPMLPIPAHDALAVALLNRYRAALYSDAEVTVASHRAFLAAPERQSEYLWIIQRNENPVGMVSVYHVDPIHRKCEWGRYLVDDSGRGIGRVVELMVLDWVFDCLGMNKLYCEVLTSNPRVIDLHVGYGFCFEALYRDHIFKDGRFRDAIGLAIRSEIWRAIRHRYHEKYGSERGRVQANLS